MVASRSSFLIQGVFVRGYVKLQSRSHRGMGVPLMLALTDELTVSHPPGAGTTVSLSSTWTDDTRHPSELYPAWACRPPTWASPLA